jgi:PAS domain S-box-containing protein
MSACEPPENRRILIIDDNRSIHEDFRKILQRHPEYRTPLADTKALLFGEEPEAPAPLDFEIDSAFQGQQGLKLVQEALRTGRPYALAFVDIRMPPGWDGIETISHIWKECPELQVVICTAYSDYSWQEMIDQLGNSDSLLMLKKPFDNIEVMQLAHALTQKWSLGNQVKARVRDLDQLVSQRTTQLMEANQRLTTEIGERTQIEKALRLSEERFSKAFRASPIPMGILSLRESRFLNVNAGFQTLAGLTREEMLGRTPGELNLWANSADHDLVRQKLQHEPSLRNFHCLLRSKPGPVRDILLSLEQFELNGEQLVLAIAQDITEQIKLENQLRQSQKMEAIGQLAAGVAHDFNNLLTVIQGHTGLLLASRTADSKDRKPLRTISAAADRASKLVRQLLTFSRRQFMQAAPMDLRDTLASVSEMLPRILGEHITVEVITGSSLPPILADAGMMEQLLMNLSVNARDAMPDGGRLTITSETVQLGPEVSKTNHEARAGRFLRLSVSDTGRGIPVEILPRIFEPFFTTKPVGKGTGLGLATVYGIAKQHQGWIEVQTQLGKGSTFQVFIPVCNQPSEGGPPVLMPQPLKGGTETILVAEDEEEVRNFVVQVLHSYGYKVWPAVSGSEALEQWAQRRNEIDLLLTDMVMPGGMSGRQLGERLQADRPGLPIIYTSGYSPGMAGKELALLEGRNFLAKPYGPARLLSVVRECLDRRTKAVS